MKNRGAMPECLSSIVGVRKLTEGMAGQCGVYFTAKCGRLGYIGRSGDIARRLAQHLNGIGKYDAVFYLPCHPQSFDKIEKLLLRMLPTAYNRNDYRHLRVNLYEDAKLLASITCPAVSREPLQTKAPQP